MITFATMKRMYSIALILVCGIMAANAQNIAKKNDSSVEPLEPQRLQGPREATEAEKEYARQYEKDKQEQAQIDYNLAIGRRKRSGRNACRGLLLSFLWRLGLEPVEAA